VNSAKSDFRLTEFPVIRSVSRSSKLLSASTADDKDVCRGAEQTGLRFYSPDGLQKRRAPLRVFEPGVEFGQDPGRALDRNERFDRQARLGRLVAQLLGAVEVGAREPLGPSGRVAVLPLANVALDDVPERRVFQEASKQTVLGGGEARDRRRCDYASRTNDTEGFPKGSEAVVPGG
jgi:hypothetical protein